MVTMDASGMQKCVVVVAAAIGILFSPLCISTFTGFSGTASAAAQKSYGEKEAVTTAEEAIKALKKHFEKKDIIIGEIIEKELYYETEIRDRNNTVIDKVIVDKRTGRIRSIY